MDSGILRESVCKGDENAGKEDREGERAGGEGYMAFLQSRVLQPGRCTESGTGDGKGVVISQNKRN